MSSAGSGNVEVRITGSLDPSLTASVRAADAQMATFGRQIEVVAGSLQRAGQGNEATAAKFVGLALANTQLGQAATVASRAVVAGAADAEKATGSVRVATSGAIQEYIRLGHEAMTGNYSRMPGSAVVLASRMGGLTAATLGTAAAYTVLGAAALAPTIALGVLAYRQLEAARNAEALATGFQLSGRGAIYTSQGVDGEINALSQLQGMSNKTAEALVAFDSTHANLNATLAIAANQLGPAYVREFGDKAPQALNALKAKLIEISTGPIPQSIREFEQLNRTTLNLPATAVPAIEEMIRSGDGLGAAMAIVTAEGQRTGTSIQTLGTLLKNTTGDLKTQQRELDSLKGCAASSRL